jgi:hypothetical protein
MSRTDSSAIHCFQKYKCSIECDCIFQFKLCDKSEYVKRRIEKTNQWKRFLFCNIILFAISTSIFRELIKSLYCDL